MGKLILISTPIGNLGDITLRSLEVLKFVDGIICEDTRRTGLLLHHFQIKKPLIILNDNNEANFTRIIVDRLKNGQSLALVSDAGTPLISDPGYKLVRECIAQGIEIDSLPGPSSVITALTLSGLPPDKFLFLGYPPEKMGKRTKWLEKFKNIDATIIILAPPHKLLRNLDSIKNVCGDIEVVLAHELTKIHQSVETRKISEWLDKLKNLKGEYILMFRLHPN